MFYYSFPNSTTKEEIEFVDDALEIEDINKYIQTVLRNKPNYKENDITITLQGAHSVITLKPGYKVYLQDKSLKKFWDIKRILLYQKQ